MNQKIAVVDIEAKELVKDWGRPWEAGISVACAWINWRGGPFGQPLFFSEERLTALYDILCETDTFVTWNGKRYDMKVIDHLLGYRGTWSGKHCDLKRLVEASAKQRLSLDPVAQASLGRGKSGNGAMAPKMHQQGQYDRLYTYNYDDVALTRDLYLFAQQHGFLWIPYGSTRRAIPVEVQG